MLTLPWFQSSFENCGINIDVPRLDLASPLTSLAIVIQEVNPGAVQPMAPVDCTSPVVAELPREIAVFQRPAAVRGGAMIRMRIEQPTIHCGRTYAFGVCLRDRTGKLHPSHRPDEPALERAATRIHDPLLDEPRVLTPSGPLRSHGIERGLQLIGADPVTGAYSRVSVRSVRRSPRTVVHLQLTNTAYANIPRQQQVWLVEEKTWIEVAKLSVGDRIRGEHGPLKVAQIELQKRRYGLEISDVSFPDTYFLDDVLVRDRHPSSGETTTLPDEQMPASSLDVALVAAAQSYDCGLSTEVTIRNWPAGAESIALIVDRHPGPSGARVESSCQAQRAFSNISHSMWEVWQTHPLTSSRPMTLALEAGEAGWEAEDPDFEGVVGCSSEVSLLACARDAQGVLTPVTKMARWGFTGASCFATGTPIDTPKGPVAIEELRPGATVLAVDVEHGDARTAHVLRRVSRGRQATLQLRLANGEVLHVTGEHPLWDPRKEVFRLAGQLQAGDRLLGRNGLEIRIEEVGAGEPVEVWDLSVDGPDTYFANGVLAHNY